MARKPKTVATPAEDAKLMRRVERRTVAAINRAARKLGPRAERRHPAPRDAERASVCFQTN